MTAAPAWTHVSSPHLRRRRRVATLFRWLCAGVTWISVLLLAVLLWHVGHEGFRWLTGQFLTGLPSRFPERVGIYPAIIGSLWLIGLTSLMAIPVGVAAATYLEEYGGKGRLHRFIEINIANLAGVPSIVYGILGLAVFVRTLGMGNSLLAGALTMALLVLPVVILASREALRAVPDSIRQAAFALGATRWQTTFHHVLPVALPGILTGIILAVSRAIGEAAPLIMVGAAAYVGFVPRSVLDDYTVLPIQIYSMASLPRAEFQQLAAAGSIVLLVVLLAMNSVAIIIRGYSSRKAL